MTRKLAVFVEGFTEQEFTIRLISELAGKHNISFEIHRQDKGHLSLVELRAHLAPFIHVLVANCCTDNQVKSQIADQYTSLQSAGYSLIIGLRDVYPFVHADIPKLESNLNIGLPVGNPAIHMHLAILEIEAWFLEELMHYERIDPNLTLPTVIASGFDYLNVRAADLPNPAMTLDCIYKSVGKRYKKKTRHIQRTVSAISYEDMYVNVSNKSPDFNKYLMSLEYGMFPTNE